MRKMSRKWISEKTHSKKKITFDKNHWEQIQNKKYVKCVIHGKYLNYMGGHGFTYIYNTMKI